MNLSKFNNKLVRIVDIEDTVFEGYSVFNDKEYNYHEYGRKEDSLQILNIMFYESYIKSVEEIKKFSDKYGNLEELICDNDLDFALDALDYENEIHNERIKLYLKDNIDKFEDKELVNKIINN